MNDHKNAIGEKILLLNKQKSLTWPQLAAEIGYSPFWTCAACLGQMSMPSEAAAKVAAMLGLSPADQALLEAIPYRRFPALPSSQRPADLPFLRVDDGVRNHVQADD
jgi:cyanate lyase